MASNNFTIQDYKSSENLLQLADKDGDGTLDPFELHSVLIDKGILVPLDVVNDIFDDVDKDDNGNLTVVELSEFLFKSKTLKGFDFCRRAWSDVDWWFLVLFFVGGVMFLIGGFHSELGIPDPSLKNIYLAGGAMYNLGTLRFIIPYLYLQYRAQQSFEKSALYVQESLRANADNYTSTAAETGIEKKLSTKSTSSEDTAETTSEKENSKLRRYTKEVIFANISTRIRRTELQMILLKEVGVISQSVRDKIFGIVDEDGNGNINADEFTSFIENWNPGLTDGQRFLLVLKGAFSNLKYCLSFIFLTGGMIGLLNNIVKRSNPDGLWDHDTITPGMVGAYCGTIGSLVFVTDRFLLQMEKIDMEEIVRDKLGKLLRKFDEEEKFQAKDKEVEAFNSNLEFTKTRFNSMLEDNGVFMPKFQVEKLFQDIDKDESDKITKNELRSFTMKKRSRLGTLLKNCFTSHIFLTYYVWDFGRIVGCAANVAIVHTNDPTVTDISVKVSVLHPNDIYD